MHLKDHEICHNVTKNSLNTLLTR